MLKTNRFLVRNNFHILKISLSSFKFADLQVDKAQEFKSKPHDCDKVGFGSEFSDHMLRIDWNSSSGWSKPHIKAVENFSLHPACIVFHYATEIFEGLKAFYGVDNVVRMFRPDQNLIRMQRSAKRAMLPDFDRNEFLDCIKELIRIDKDWVPKSRGNSLYIRPTMIGVDPKLGVAKSNMAILYVLLCPVGPYYPTGFKPVSLFADPNYIRAWPGGSGDNKMGSNYGPTIYVQNEAHKRGCQQVLWLFGEDRLLSEVGTMNIFVYWINKSGKEEIVTPPLNGTILPGITRMSLIDLLKEEKKVEISEREIPIKELFESLKENRLLEVFGAGTACVVAPVESIHYEGNIYNIPTMVNGAPLTMRMLQKLTDIQYGVTKREDWTVTVP